jgi:sugar lactone lactonase YvrE
MRIFIPATAVLLIAISLVFNSCNDDDSTTASPSITDFSPTEGIAGTTVTISGANFSIVTSENIVKFNGTRANVTAATTTTLTVTAPAGATTGKITVEVGTHTATSVNDFTVLTIPTISGFSPTKGTSGTIITITGTNFSTVIGENIVKFNGKAANVTAATTTTLMVAVPVEATTGKITVQVDIKIATSSDDFVYVPQMMVSTLAGSGSAGFVDGVGTAAQFNDPIGIAVDAAGNLYVADTKNNRIRKITFSGEVSTLAGSGTAGSADGTGTNAEFSTPFDVAVDASGNVYVADYGNNRIRKITTSGVVSTLAGSTAGFVNGTGTAAKFSGPEGVVVDASGNVYVADHRNHCIRKITAGGEVTTLAGSGTLGFVDGTSTAAQFYGPTDVAVDGTGNIYVADRFNHHVRKITSEGVVSTLGNGATFSGLMSVAVDAEGNVYISDNSSNRISKIADGVVTTLAGSVAGFADGAATDAKFNGPAGVVIDASGNIYVVDEINRRIRKIAIQ